MIFSKTFVDIQKHFANEVEVLFLEKVYQIKKSLKVPKQSGNHRTRWHDDIINEEILGLVMINMFVVEEKFKYLMTRREIQYFKLILLQNFIDDGEKF